MIAVETNVLVHAHRPEMPDHARASAVLAQAAEGAEPWAIPLHCLVEFAGVVTKPRLWRQASSPGEVADQVAAWRESPTLRLLGDDEGYWEVFAAVLTESKVAGGAVHDARIAASCRHHGVRELWSADRDFSRFPWLKVRNPLVG